MRYFFVILFLITYTTTWAQQENVLNAHILSTTKEPIENAHILNLSKNTATTSNKMGAFAIKVSVNDSVVISALGYKNRTFIVNPTLINQKDISFELTEQVEELEEVELIHYSKINAKDLGIIPKDQKQYTPAEKNLFMQKTGVVEGIINRLNGNVKRAKELVELEKDILTFEKLKNRVPTDFLINELNIPELYADAFYLYCTEDPVIVANLENSSLSKLKFLLMEKAVPFLEIISKLTNEQE